MNEQRFSRRPVLHVVLIFADAVLAILGCFSLAPRAMRALLERWRLSLIVVAPQIPWADLRAVEPKLSEWAP